jgi:hypothetical protein
MVFAGRWIPVDPGPLVATYWSRKEMNTEQIEQTAEARA